MAVLAGVPVMSLAGGSPDNPLPSGVSGMVALIPGCPGPQKKGEDCHKPLPGKPVQLIDSSGKVVASAISGDDGKFALRAMPGDYTLKVVIDAYYPRCPTVDVLVPKEGLAESNIVCDSGMR